MPLLNEWEIKNLVIATRAVPEKHTGKHIRETLTAIKQEFGICKLTGVVTDNAANMVTAMAEVAANGDAHTAALSPAPEGGGDADGTGGLGGAKGSAPDNATDSAVTGKEGAAAKDHTSGVGGGGEGGTKVGTTTATTTTTAEAATATVITAAMTTAAT